MSWNVCNGRCKHFDGYKKTCRNAYIDGYTRCNTCNAFWFTEKTKCECCKSRLRKPKKEPVRL